MLEQFTDSRIPSSYAINNTPRPGTLKLGGLSLFCDYQKGEKWTQGDVMAQTGPVSYKVSVGEQGVWKRLVDQMLACAEQTLQESAGSAVPLLPWLCVT